MDRAVFPERHGAVDVRAGDLGDLLHALGGPLPRQIPDFAYGHIPPVGCDEYAAGPPPTQQTGRETTAPREGRQIAAAADLAATPFIQSDNARIAAAAKGIVAGATNSLDSALAVNRWVHARMRRNPQVSIPSAVEVLNRLEGDCNEHSYLAVALARAAGIPARVKVGIVYSEGKFYYHAWIAMYAGRWIEMDPTFGQDAVDATHIALLEGELKDQLKLVQVFGQLRAEILSERCAR